MKMIYNKDLKRFEIFTSFDEYKAGWTARIKAAGFRFEKEPKALWHTESRDKASLFIKCADETAQDMLRERAAVREQSITLSRAENADLGDSIRDLGTVPYPYQRAGIAYGMLRDASLIADEPGLGKTLQSLALLHIRQSYPAVAVVPATIKINWLKEARRNVPELREDGAVAILSGRAKPGQELPVGAKMYIINYDILKSWLPQLIALKPKALIVDESHFAKNVKADRTLSCLELATGLRRDGRKRIKIHDGIQFRYLLSGTPQPNRPDELVSQLEMLGVLDLFGGEWGFYKRFCQLTENWVFKPGGRGARMKVWEHKGATNTEELQRLLREHVMVRRRKEDVLTELPPKRHQCIELASNGLKYLSDREAEIEYRFQQARAALERAKQEAQDSGNQDSFERAAKDLTRAYEAHFTEMAVLAHEVALAKVPKVVEYCLEVLEGEKKIAVFAHHQDVHEALQKAFEAAGKKVVRLTGTETAKQKDASVEAFQNGDADIFLGALKCGIGYTITAASRAIMAELDWTPGVMDQASDRLHRIGQRDSVLITYITLEDSLDSKKVGMLLDKREVARQILDNTLPVLDVPVGEPKPKVDRPDLPPSHVFAILDRLGISLEEVPF